MMARKHRDREAAQEPSEAVVSSDASEPCEQVIAEPVQAIDESKNCESETSKVESADKELSMSEVPSKLHKFMGDK